MWQDESARRGEVTKSSRLLPLCIFQTSESSFRLWNVSPLLNFRPRSLLIASCCIWRQRQGYYPAIQHQYYETMNFATARTMCISDVVWQPRKWKIFDYFNSSLPLKDFCAAEFSSMAFAEPSEWWEMYRLDFALKHEDKTASLPVEWMHEDEWLMKNAGTNHSPPLASGMWFKRLEVQTHSIN